MKRILLFWSAAAAGLLLSACTKDEAAEPEPQQPAQMERLYLSDETTEAEAAAAADPQSRAAFVDGYKIAWEAGDQVAIVRGTPYAVQQDGSGRWYVELPSADSYTVYYPAAWCGKVEQGLLSSKISYSQTYRPGSFDPAALLARAVANRGEKLTFKYMCSVVKLTLKGTGTEQVKTIEISTKKTGSEYISSVGVIQTGADGTAYISPMTGTFEGYSRQFVTLTADNVALTPAGVDFYITLFPTTFSQGFTITVTLADGRQMIKTGGVGQTARRGRILAMPALQFEEANTTAPVYYSTDNTTWTPWEYASGTTPATLAYPASQKLYFKDNAGAATPGLTHAHLQSLADTFRNQDSATAKPISLDMGKATLAGTTEFPSDVFNVFCWNGSVKVGGSEYSLKQIVFPKNITRIADLSIKSPISNYAKMAGAFMGCDGFESMEIPSRITHVGSGAFAICRNIKTLTISGSDQPLTIEKYAFFVPSSSSLAEVRCERTTPPTLVLDGTATPFNKAGGTGGIVFRVPAASLAAYKADAGWQAMMAEGTNRTWATF